MNGQQLKNSILQLAIKGKLVEQIEEEGAADEIARNTDINSSEVPFELPPNWKWIKLKDIAQLKLGKTPKRSEINYWKPDVPWVAISDMVSDNLTNTTKEKISKTAFHESFKSSLSPKGTLLMSFKLTIGKVSILDIDAVHNEAIVSIFPIIKDDNILRDYLFRTLPLLVKYAHTKVAIKGKTLNLTNLKNLIIPLPPLKEQKRIVKKLEELLPKISQYDKLYTEITELNKNFPENLKKSILKYAISGKLTNQDLDKTTGHELYKYSITKKNDLVKQKLIKKERKIENEKIIAVPFDIPETWSWVRLGNIAHLKIGKTPTRSNDQYWSTDYPWVSIADLSDNNYINTTKEKISETAFQEKFKGILSPKGTLLMSFKLTIGKVSILDIDAVHNEAITSIIPFVEHENILRDYLFKTLPLLVNYADIKGAIKGKTLNSTSLNNLMVSLPPLEEQNIIVNEINAFEKFINLLQNL